MLPFTAHVPPQRFMGKHHAVVLSRFELEAVAVVAEVQLCAQHLGGLTTKMQHRIGATGIAHKHLELLVQNAPNEFEKPNEVGLARAIGPDQHIDRPQGQIALGNRLVAFQYQPRELVGVGDLFRHHLNLMVLCRRAYTSAHWTANILRTLACTDRRSSTAAISPLRCWSISSCRSKILRRSGLRLSSGSRRRLCRCSFSSNVAATVAVRRTSLISRFSSLTSFSRHTFR